MKPVIPVFFATDNNYAPFVAITLESILENCSKDTICIEKHNQKIELYRKNHPDYKCIFFIVDESSAYLVAQNKNEIPAEIVPGAPFFGKPHIHFLDKNFVSCLARINADFIIWFNPYKHLNFANPGFRQLPNVCVYEVSKLNNAEAIEYDTAMIFQAEA